MATGPSIEIRRLESTEVGDAVEVLSRAFQEDPGAVIVEPDPSRRPGATTALFAPVVRWAMPFGHVSAAVADGQVIGVATFVPPGHDTPTEEELDASGLQAAVELLVRAMIEAADDVRDPEVRVVDDAREVISSAPVFSKQRGPFEALAELGAGLAVAVLPLALPYRPLVPFHPEPFEVAQDRRLAARHVARLIGVVDPQQHPVTERAIRDGAQGVADVE